jgi:PAS domain S-box-containing protein
VTQPAHTPTRPPASPESVDLSARLAARAAGIGFYSFNVETGVNEWSAELKAIAGLPASEDVPLERVFALIHPADREDAVRTIRRSLTAPTDGSLERTFEHEHRLVRPDGESRNVLVRGRTSFVLRGSVVRPLIAIGVAVDVTQQNDVTAQLRISEERYRLASEAVAGMIYDWDVTTGRCTRSDGLTRLLGIAPGEDEPTRTWWTERVHPDDLGRVNEVWRASVAGGLGTTESRYRVRHAAGRWIWIEDRLRIVRDASGEVVRGVGATKDVTAEVETEDRVRELIRERESAIAQLRALVRAAPVGITLLDRQERYHLINDRLADINGVPSAEHIGRTLEEVVPGLAPLVRPLFDRVVSERITIDTVVQGETPHAPGVKRTWAESWFPVPDGGGEVAGVGVIVQDITDQRAADEALRRSEARFRALTESIPQLVWACDAAGCCTYVSSQWRALTGQSDAEAMGDGWIDATHPDDRERQAVAWRAAVVAGSPYESDVRMRLADGSYRWFLARATAFRRSDGSIDHWIGTSTDIEHRKQAEALLNRDRDALERLVTQRTAQLEELHRRQRLQERLTLMGTLAAGLGHDIGNLLVPVRISLDCLDGEALPPGARDDVRAIRASFEYAERLAGGLRLLALDPGRATDQDQTPVDDWWRQAEPLLRAVLRPGIKLEGAIDGGRLIARITLASLMQIAFNLVQNASESMRERGSGTVRVAARRTNRDIVLTVSDNGPGMTADVRRRCLEPFFTTRSRLESTGLGLALVYTCVHQAAGSIDIDSAPGRGTTFTIRIPAAEESPLTTRRHAMVEVKDERMRSFIISELAVLACEIDPGAPNTVDIVVVDTLVGREAGVPGWSCPVIVLGDEPSGGTPAHVHAIGPAPSPHQIRRMLRQFAAGGR